MSILQAFYVVNETSWKGEDFIPVSHIVLDEKLTFRLGKLRNNFKEMVAELKKGWQEQDLAQFPRANNFPELVQKPLKDWLLFFKKKSTDSELSLIKEERLMRYLSSKFQVKDEMKCGYSWVKPDLEESVRLGEMLRKDAVESRDNELYLWVKKDSFRKIESVFRLEIVKSSKQSLSDNNNNNAKLAILRN
jgi:hypothetical protein